MAGLNRPLLRSLSAFWKAGMLLGVAGLAAVSLENISFGHGHLGEPSIHHHHVYSGPHGHPGAQPGHDHEAPAPDDDRETPHRTTIVSAAPPLFQPAAASVQAAPLAHSTLPAIELTLPRVAWPMVRHASPRAPPASDVVSDSLN